MSKFGPLLVIEDDADDKKIFEEVIRDLGYNNKVVWYDNTDDALSYLQTTSESIFVIFSDINLPGNNGLDMKKQIDSDPQLRKKSIPFVFYSTSAHQEDIDEAFLKMTVQGFFRKGRNIKSMKEDLSLILEYWKACRHPNIQ